MYLTNKQKEEVHFEKTITLSVYIFREFMRNQAFKHFITFSKSQFMLSKHFVYL